MIAGTSIVVPRTPLPQGITGLPIWELRTGPTDYIVLLSIGLSFQGSSSTVFAFGFGLGSPAARGINPWPNSITALQDAPHVSLGGLSIATAWGTPPTAPTAFLRRETVNITGGVGLGPVLHSFDGGRIMTPSSSLVLWAITASAVNYSNAGTSVETSLEIAQ